jgi:hypothetical protein
MKSIYKQLAFGTLMTAAIQAQAVEKVSLTLYDLTAAKIAAPVTDTYGNSITIAHNTATLQSGSIYRHDADIANPLECAIVGETAETGFTLAAASDVSGNYTAITMGGANVPSGTNAIKLAKCPYLIFRFTPSATNPVTKIHLMGKAIGGDQDILWAFNETSGAAIGANTWETPDPDNDEPLHFLNGACNSTNLKIAIPEGTGAFAILLGGNVNLAGIGLDSYANQIKISAIRFYVEDSGTGLTEAATIEKTPVSSKYYDLTGREVAADTKGFVIKKTIYSDGSIVGAKQQNH